jgi:hypothetical protein
MKPVAVALCDWRLGRLQRPADDLDAIAFRQASPDRRSCNVSLTVHRTCNWACEFLRHKHYRSRVRFIAIAQVWRRKN